jgi:hypothetical protein
MFDTADPRNPVQDASVELIAGPQPHDIVWLPGDRAYVANTNNMQPYGSLSVIHNYSGVPSVSGPILTDLAGPLSFAYFDALPASVGGMAEPPDVTVLPARADRSPDRSLALYAASAAAVVALLLIVAGGWYARRRRRA